MPPAARRVSYDHDGKMLHRSRRHPEPQKCKLWLYIIIMEEVAMKMLSPSEVARITGLPYIKALLLIKSANHVQIGNRYYISEDALYALLNPNEPILIEED